jgi:hypothetical protein
MKKSVRFGLYGVVIAIVAALTAIPSQVQQGAPESADAPLMAIVDTADMVLAIREKTAAGIFARGLFDFPVEAQSSTNIWDLPTKGHRK